MPWAEEVTIADSSPTGFGVCYRPCEAAEVGRIGRLAEKWRFGVAACVRARAHALGVAANEGYLDLDPATLT
eukprot:7562049-Lingulodinium_polyedra.AAC.1